MLGGLRLLFRRRIAVKLTLTLLGFVAVVEVVAGIYLTRALEERAVQALEARLVALLRLLQDDARALLAIAATPQARREFALRTARLTEARVTLIMPDGRVVAESDRALGDLAKIENHRERPEVRTALAGGIGRAIRRSETVAHDLLYVALPVVDGSRTAGIIRLALPLEVVTGAYAAVRQALLAGGVLALGVALAMGLLLAGRVTRPVVEMQSAARQMAEGDLTVRAPVRTIDEIGGLGRALNVMASRLREKIQDLERAQATTKAIVDGMVEGVLAVDARDHILLLNQSVRTMFRLGPRLGEGKPFLEVIRNADLLDLLRGCRVEGVMVSRELVVTTPVERILAIHALPLRLGAGETGVLMILHDVTELRRLERVRTEFVANVSHELRTPLTAIRGYLETLLGGSLEERDNARRFLEIVSRHTERLGRLLDDLTDLSNIELGKVALRVEPTDLNDALEPVLAIMRSQAEGKGVSLDAALPTDLPPVLADQDRLEQILINLMDNAVKFTPPEGRVMVSAAVRDRMVEVSVADTGVGIPSTDLPRITERFYRVDRTRSRQLGGTGLGLAIVKHLVQAHGGGLGIESELGKGTTVRFTLPVA